jgi:hypothetical protein
MICEWIVYNKHDQVLGVRGNYRYGNERLGGDEGEASDVEGEDVGRGG